jgi:phosphatidyl-myo-inositol dimannoside synthase
MVVVGNRWDESEWQILAKNARVDYRGVVTNEELLELRRSALVVLMPNITTEGNDIEGFGLTALEAAADGGVLLASGIEGIVDAVVDGETGFLLPAKNATAWAKKIDEVSKWSSEDRSLFIHRAREVIKERYSWKQVARDTHKIYEDCLKLGVGN